MKPWHKLQVMFEKFKDKLTKDIYTFLPGSLSHPVQTTTSKQLGSLFFANCHYLTQEFIKNKVIKLRGVLREKRCCKRIF
eukprot:snap_masked-scaffold_17-processed-gene-5.15-mRNA-1 protein AED:1.00 eAED:1.00 QI:0/-1/0/0/-1/1/1/0/79